MDYRFLSCTFVLLSFCYYYYFFVRTLLVNLLIKLLDSSCVLFYFFSSRQIFVGWKIWNESETESKNRKWWGWRGGERLLRVEICTETLKDKKKQSHLSLFTLPGKIKWFFYQADEVLLCIASFFRLSCETAIKLWLLLLFCVLLLVSPVWWCTYKHLSLFHLVSSKKQWKVTSRLNNFT